MQSLFANLYTNAQKIFAKVCTAWFLGTKYNRLLVLGRAPMKLRVACSLTLLSISGASNRTFSRGSFAMRVRAGWRRIRDTALSMTPASSLKFSADRPWASLPFAFSISRLLVWVTNGQETTQDCSNDCGSAAASGLCREYLLTGLDLLLHSHNSRRFPPGSFFVVLIRRTEGRD
jgi:hypothetical protein